MTGSCKGPVRQAGPVGGQSVDFIFVYSTTTTAATGTSVNKRFNEQRTIAVHVRYKYISLPSTAQKTT